MATETYVGSRSVEIAAMVDQIESRHGHAGTYLADPPAGADSPVAVDARHVTPGKIRVEAAAERDDVDAVEHIRQNRLRRWQTPPLTTR